ncbi:hypothetical protein J2S00_003815 [Caldalkalibacillus uzonensis]|uniref:Uncharacterized protein n=1 Tax=Caldalkalibacillus uzonensis TaxID=353224 RepID=A0ABU0CXV6_9BACI|nr:hypothetical protein [Caldalkalibacillus uzonensis]MDQ0340975.1 hypothetical protein [Caldalkalibacillus uzonensis]
MSSTTVCCKSVLNYSTALPRLYILREGDLREHGQHRFDHSLLLLIGRQAIPAI